VVFNEDKAVGMLAEVIALECGIAPAKARLIRVAASLHDIGKQKMRHLVNKPGKLTATEFEVIKTHTTLGAAMLATFHGDLGELSRNIAQWHHEHWDGSGYYGKRLSELPSYVGMVAIADVFTALIYGRAYKQPWPPAEALAYIESHANTHFDSALVKKFVPLARSDSRVLAIFAPVIGATGGERHTGRFGIQERRVINQSGEADGAGIGKGHACGFTQMETVTEHAQGG
jgi:putative nucleotidyltransferase with HDIG domain